MVLGPRLCLYLLLARKRQQAALASAREAAGPAGSAGVFTCRTASSGSEGAPPDPCRWMP